MEDRTCAKRIIVGTSMESQALEMTVGKVCREDTLE